ncbi:MAG: MoxR family ATPase [Candidatus Aenigmarchaeota archaeon]|nr:MoxR family ATPase [Candidatus Aenigmarchaeota archaeon]
MLEEYTTYIKYFNKKVTQTKKEVHKTIIGQEGTIDYIMRAILANGHVLLEGAPGAAKTLLINSFALTVRNAIFKRIQFTPDLLPADVVGLTAYSPEKGFYTVKGPCFANFLLADEINRAPPKVQSAMLELMQERQVTIGRKTFQLPKPFLVLATENPVEQGGTFPLPEAQVDRFLFKIIVDYPPKEDEIYLVENNSTVKSMDEFKIHEVTTPEDLVIMQKMVKKIYLSPAIRQYIVDIIMTTRAQREFPYKYAKYLAWGSSPRASIALFVGSKAVAFTHNRSYVIPEDVREVSTGILRHRMLMNYEGKASNINPDTMVEEIIRIVPVP